MRKIFANVFILLLLLCSVSFASTRATSVKFLISGLKGSSGSPLAGYKVYFYKAGTTTTKDVYTDYKKTAVLTQPIILDSLGSAVVYAYGVYTVYITDPSDNAFLTISEIDFGASDTGYYDVADYQAGALLDLNAAVNDIGTQESDLYINDDATLTGNLTIPSNIRLRFTASGRITQPSSYTLTVNGPIEASPTQQLFYGFSGSQITIDSSANPEIHAEWFGTALDVGANLCNNHDFMVGTPISLPANTTFGSTCNLTFIGNGSLDCNTHSLTVNGSISARNTQIFQNCSNLITISNNTKTIMSDWVSDVTNLVNNCSSQDIIVTSQKTLSGNITLPSTCSLVFASNGQIDCNSKTVTVNGQIIANNKNVFTNCSGNVDFSSYKGLIYSNWDNASTDRLVIKDTHISSKQSSAPTITNCNGGGSNGTLSSGSTDIAGEVVINDSNDFGTCTLNFAQAFSTTPICIATPYLSNSTTPCGTTVAIDSVSTSSVTFFAPSHFSTVTTSDFVNKFSYHCFELGN